MRSIRLPIAAAAKRATAPACPASRGTSPPSPALLPAREFVRPVELADGILLHPGRHADASRLGQCFERCRYIDAISKDVIAIDDDVALVDANTERNLVARRTHRVPGNHFALHRSRTGNRFDRADGLG